MAAALPSVKEDPNSLGHWDYAVKKGREGVLGKVSLYIEENGSRDFPKSWSP